jgi:hypothetical protein
MAKTDAADNRLPVLVIKDDDRKYEEWLRAHPHGFVINTPRVPDKTYVKLHASECWTINGVPSRGAKWTEGQYIKVCSESRSELEKWTKEKFGIPLTDICKTCFRH